MSEIKADNILEQDDSVARSISLTVRFLLPLHRHLEQPTAHKWNLFIKWSSLPPQILPL